MGVILRERQLPSGRKSLVLSYYRRTPQGERKWEQRIKKTGEILTGDKKHDAAARERAQEKLKDARRLFARQTGIASPDQFEDGSFIEFVQELIETKATRNTKDSYKHALTYFAEFVGGDISFADINRPLIEGFKKHLEKAKPKLHPNTVHHYLGGIKTALGQAVRKNLISDNPAAYVTAKTVQRTPIYLSLEEVSQLARTPIANPHIRNAFFFEVATGMRISDIRQLTWDKIRNDCITFTQKKTGAPEILPLSQSALEILEAQRKLTGGQGEVFTLPRTPSIDRTLGKWGERAGLDKRIGTHVARHTFATLGIGSGVSVYEISKLLGHANIRTTEIYASVSDKAKIAAVQMLPRLDLGGDK